MKMSVRRTHPEIYFRILSVRTKESWKEDGTVQG